MSFDKYQPIYEFHKSFFPDQTYSLLRHLPGAPGARWVYVKDESNRYGLSSFKILGASWGLAYALSKRFRLSTRDVAAFKKEVRGTGVRVHAATDGNHGRAVAYTARMLGLRCFIYVPRTVEQWSIDQIAAEGATVQKLDMDYDSAIKYAAKQASGEKELLVQDTAFEGYTEIPQAIVEGYTHLFAEVKRQPPPGIIPTHIIVPVGVGSLAHSAALAYKGTNVRIITVEPDTAACLQASLRAGKRTTIQAGETIMPGLNCGTVSLTAWPELFAAVRLEDALTVSDEEVGDAMGELEKWGIEAGPCGAAPYAALKKLDLPPESVVVLVCTEGRQGT